MSEFSVLCFEIRIFDVFVVLCTENVSFDKVNVPQFRLYIDTTYNE